MYRTESVTNRLKWNCLNTATSNAIFEPASSGLARPMSLLVRAYYRLKPYLPLKASYGLRRIRARYKLATSNNWPITESAARLPANWHGWPDGKKFAVVLTHDVEGPTGVSRTRQIASMEEKLGFRGSFNFIPEGNYRLSAELRNGLKADGLEVGVHDLHHDGSLFRTREGFSAAAVRINEYINEWGAAGFRAGFMFHNLEWIKELNVEYDASTFDVDPFEAQPDGMGTIFPFWVSKGGRGGYVELPYTLAQDSTMFLILREKTIRYWKMKVDWIAKHGGMALINLHPDYVAFGSREKKASEFDSGLYSELLSYIRDRYSGEYWHALPREVARFFRRAMVERAAVMA